MLQYLAPLLIKLKNINKKQSVRTPQNIQNVQTCAAAVPAIPCAAKPPLQSILIAFIKLIHIPNASAPPITYTTAS